MAIVVDDAAIDLPRKYYPAIGEFIFRYAQLEYQMSEIIWRALKIGNKEGRVLTVGTDARVLCATINVIASENPYVTWVNKTHAQEMNSIANDARKLYTFRNLLAHGTWQHPPGKPQEVRIHFMKDAEVRIMPRLRKDIDDAEIHRKSGKLRSLNVRAEKLIKNLWNELTLSQQKSA